MATLRQEGARPATHFRAVLGEADCREFGHRDQIAVLAVVQHMALMAAIDEAIGYVARDREIAERPYFQIARKTRCVTKAEFQRKISLGDGLTPIALAYRRSGLRGRIFDSHSQAPVFTIGEDIVP